MKIVRRTSIHKTLKGLDVLYRRARTSKEALFFSKLGILELGGWIEETMDQVIRSCASRTLQKSANQERIEKEVILKNYNFDYENNFRKMLTQVIGLKGVEKRENGMDPIMLQKLKTTLGNIKARRDQEAHRHLSLTMPTLDAPSVTLQNFEQIYTGLKEISAQLKKMGF
jgi:hypothetical protein